VSYQGSTSGIDVEEAALSDWGAGVRDASDWFSTRDATDASTADSVTVSSPLRRLFARPVVTTGLPRFLNSASFGPG
jgi:hypothetical protein